MATTFQMLARQIHITRSYLLFAFVFVLEAFAQEGTLVDVGSHKLNVVCTGQANRKPVVIFVAGGGGSSASWKAVQSNLPTTIRACAYDRAGSGKSEPGPAPRSMEAEVADLHAWLEKMQINDSVVFVGHSLGSILGRLYMQKYPVSVAGAILVDPTHEEDQVYSTRLNRWITLSDLEDSIGEGARIVISAGKRVQPPGTSAEQWTEMRNARDNRVKELTRLSSRSQFILDPLSSHNIERDNPGLIAAAIQSLLEKIQARPTSAR